MNLISRLINRSGLRISHSKVPSSDPMDQQHFGYPDPNPQKYADPWIQIQRSKYQQKMQTK